MLELLTAIQTHFSANADLATLFPDGCYLSLAPDAKPLPVCVLTFVSAAPQWNTGGYYLNVVNLQFSIYAQTDTAALNGAAAVAKAFDFASLPLATQQCVSVRRTNEGIIREDERVWHALVQYEVWVGESLPT